jgi:hypothetical protein
MKNLLAAAITLGAIALGASDGTAQTSQAAPGSAGSMSPVGMTSPLGTGSAGSISDPQGVTLPYSTTTNPGPCATASQATGTLPAFDGGGITLSTNSALAAGAGTSASAPCDSVSTSGVVSSSATAAATSAAIPGATAAVVAGLGASALGSTGLGAGLGSSSTMPTSTSPATSTTASSLPRYCSEATAGGSAASVNLYGESTSSTGAGGYGGGSVPNRTQGVAGGVYDPAQSLGGEAGLPPIVPCISGE